MQSCSTIALTRDCKLELVCVCLGIVEIVRLGFGTLSREGMVGVMSFCLMCWHVFVNLRWIRASRI